MNDLVFCKINEETAHQFLKDLMEFAVYPDLFLELCDVHLRVDYNDKDEAEAYYAIMSVVKNVHTIAEDMRMMKGAK